MTQKTYRTAQGRIVDLGALQLQNENVRAVGNMSVNARGDVVDGYNRPIDPKSQQVKRQYNRQTSNVKDEPLSRVAQATPPSAVMPPPTVEAAPAAKPAKKTKAEIPPPPEDFDDAFVKPAESTVETKPANAGLAAAIAKARSIKQENTTETKSSVRKI